jgi:hypothetical protein
MEMSELLTLMERPVPLKVPVIEMNETPDSEESHFTDVPVIVTFCVARLQGIPSPLTIPFQLRSHEESKARASQQLAPGRWQENHKTPKGKGPARPRSHWGSRGGHRETIHDFGMPRKLGAASGEDVP